MKIRSSPSRTVAVRVQKGGVCRPYLSRHLLRVRLDKTMGLYRQNGSVAYETFAGLNTNRWKSTRKRHD